MKRNVKTRLGVTGVIATCLLLSMAITGCGKDNANSVVTPEENNSTVQNQQEEGVKPQLKSSQEKDTTLKQLTEMIGKDDAEVKDLYGGGTENKTEDGTILLGRSYETTVQGNAIMLEAGYDESNKVVNLSLIFNELGMDEAKAMFKDAFGESKTVDETEAMDTKYDVWMVDNVEIILNGSYGTTAAQITLIQ